MKSFNYARSLLDNNIDSNTRIDIFAHGDTINETHNIGLLSPNAQSETSKTIQLLDQCRAAPLTINLRSCRAGAAAKDILFSKLHSSLIAHTEAESDSISLIEMQSIKITIQGHLSDLRDNSIQSLLDNLPIETHSITISRKLGEDHIL